MHRSGAALLVLLAMPAAAQTIPAGVASCSGCHSPAGNTAIPGLRGIPAADMTTAMLAFRAGTRPATVMDRIAKGFTEDEIRAVSAWLAAQP